MTIYSNEPDLLRPVLEGMPRVFAVYRKPEEYRANDRGLVILDRFIPPQRPTADSIWIDPPAQGSPIPIRTVVSDVPFEKWDSDGAVVQGLRAKDFKLEKTSVFEAAPDDTRIGEVEAGPVIVARGGAQGTSSPAQPRVVVFGFHPALSGMRYELVTPLLFANLLRWVSPDIFYRSEFSVGSVGTVKLVMDRNRRAFRAGRCEGYLGKRFARSLYTARPHAELFLRFTRLGAGAGGRPRIPVLADSAAALGYQMDGAGRSAPGHSAFCPDLDRSTDLWPWLALAGGAGLWRNGCCSAAPAELGVRGGWPDRSCCAGGAPWRQADDLRASLDAAVGLAARGMGGMGVEFVRRRAALLLKAASLAAILAAVAVPRMVVYQSKVAVALLADTSASVTAQDLSSESAFADKAQRARGRHWLKVIPFARSTRNATPEEQPKGGWQLRHAAGAAGHATNLEAAIRDGAASFPPAWCPGCCWFPTAMKRWAA